MLDLLKKLKKNQIQETVVSDSVLNPTHKNLLQMITDSNGYLVRLIPTRKNNRTYLAKEFLLSNGYVKIIKENNEDFLFSTELGTQHLSLNA